MLIVISYPTAVTDEATIINALFDEGLEILHLRKPDAAADEIRILIEKIKPQYHHQIALHQHHEIASEFGIKRLHFREAKRKEMCENELIQLREANNILSTSVHDMGVYEGLSSCFKYAFFGPVFNSISKQGYASKLTAGFIFSVQKHNPKVIAIGGIEVTNIHKVMDMKFDGIAALGTIWQKPEESLRRFKALQKAWKQTDL